MAEQQRTNDEQRIRSRIEARRARMGVAIEEIGAHLNPDHLKDEFRTGVREQVEQTKREIRGATIGRAETLINDMEDTVNRTRRTLMETIRDNPVPAAMAGIGLGWLIVDARRHASDDEYDGYAVGGRYDRDHYGRYGGEYGGGARTYDRYGVASTGPGYVGPYGRTAPPMSDAEMRGEGTYAGGSGDPANGMDRVKAGASERMDDVRDAAGRGREKLSGAADEVRDAAERVQDRAHDAAERAREGASDLAHRAEDAWHDAGHHARRAGREVRHLSEENPLAAGAVALALGFAAGMLVPETSREHRLMGPARDRMVDRAQEAASDTMDKVGRVAEKTAEEARETAEREAEKEGLVDDVPSSGDGLADRPAGGF